MLQRFYVRVLLPVDDFNIDVPTFRSHYFIVDANGRRFVTPIVDRELRRTGHSRKIKMNDNTGMGKINITIEEEKFDEKFANWNDLESLYPKQINVI